MSKIKFMKAMSHVDDRILERYMKVEKQLTATKRSSIWSRITTIAACLVLVVAVLFLSVLHGQNPAQPPREPIYTAQEIAKMLNKNTYPTVTVSDPVELDLSPILNQETISVYQDKHTLLPLDASALRTFIDSILPKICNALGTQVPEYSTTQNPSEGSEGYTDPEPYTNYRVHSRTEFGNWRFSARQASSRHYFALYGETIDGKQQYIALDGETIQIDLKHSDSEVISSLETAKKKLFEIFGASFTDVLIYRLSNSTSVYFYNADATPVNQYAALTSAPPASDYILITFEASESTSETTDNSIWYANSVQYMTNLIEIGEVYAHSQVKLLTLAQAEELLQKGYIFGSHSCPECLHDPEQIHFQDYDFVELQHQLYIRMDSLFTVPFGDTALPCYIFYKEIETTEDGITYAYAYVPAIEIEGMEEFFTAAQSYHDKD